MKLIIGIAAVVLIVGVGFLVTNDRSPASSVETDLANERVDDVDRARTETPSPVDEPLNDAVLSKDEVPEPVAGVYAEYDPALLAQDGALRTVLFFHATWCPSCRALDAQITANRDAIPAGMVIYKVDYDTSDELKRTYGITTQHSVVEINESGDVLSSVTHPSTFQELLAGF